MELNDEQKEEVRLAILEWQNQLLKHENNKPNLMNDIIKKASMSDGVRGVIIVFEVNKLLFKILREKRIVSKKLK